MATGEVGAVSSVHFSDCGEQSSEIGNGVLTRHIFILFGERAVHQISNLLM